MATSPAAQQHNALAKPATPASSTTKLTAAECNVALTALFGTQKHILQPTLIATVAGAVTDILGNARYNVPKIATETLESAWRSSAADLVAQQAVVYT